MNAEMIMDALGKVKEDYILEAAPGKKKTQKSYIGWVAAAIVLVAILTFFQTAPGAQALEIVKEAIADVIETLFPPKDVEIVMEGFEETVHYEAIVQEPETQEGGTATSGFVIYYDTDRYEMVEEDGVYYIRAIMVLPTREEIRKQNKALFVGLTEEEAEAKIDELLAQREAFYASLPPTEMEIRHIPDLAPADAAEAARAAMVGSWENVSEIRESETTESIYFGFSAGQNWDSACGDIDFFSDGQGGTYQITCRYIFEGIEGHGVRFAYMVRTFEVLAPEE